MTAADLNRDTREALYAAHEQRVFLIPRATRRADRPSWAIISEGGGDPVWKPEAVQGLIDRGLIEPPHRDGQPARLTAEGRRIVSREQSALSRLRAAVEARTVALQDQAAADEAVTPLVVAARLADFPVPVIAEVLGASSPAQVSRKYRAEFATLTPNLGTRNRPTDGPALRKLKAAVALHASAAGRVAAEEGAVAKAVVAARTAGVPWSQIGEILGMEVSSMVVKYRQATDAGRRAGASS